MSAATFAALIQGFFADRLLRQMRASANTVAGYRDAFRLLLRYAAQRLGKEPSDLAIDDLDPALVTDFLDFLESERGNTARTRNNRLAAIRSFFRHVAMNEPAHACTANASSPSLRSATRKRRSSFSNVWRSRRSWQRRILRTGSVAGDSTILLVLVQTGLRISELTSLRSENVVLGASAHVQCEGKGRKRRCIPCDETRSRPSQHGPVSCVLGPDEPMFPSSRGGRLSTDAAQRLVAKHARAAAVICPSIAEKNVTPHVLRHSTAMALRERGST